MDKIKTIHLKLLFENARKDGNQLIGWKEFAYMCRQAKFHLSQTIASKHVLWYSNSDTYLQKAVLAHGLDKRNTYV